MTIPFALIRANRIILMTLMICLVCLSGCSNETEKNSLFDDDHEIPSHWPSNLGEAVVKIRGRLIRLDEQDETVAAELFDLVSWTPELAAETSMSESQWNPIYDASESLRLRLTSNNGLWDAKDRQSAAALCDLIDDAWRKLPEKERQQSFNHGHSHAHDDDEHSASPSAKVLTEHGDEARNREPLESASDQEGSADQSTGAGTEAPAAEPNSAEQVEPSEKAKP